MRQINKEVVKQSMFDTILSTGVQAELAEVAGLEMTEPIIPPAPTMKAGGGGANDNTSSHSLCTVMCGNCMNDNKRTEPYMPEFWPTKPWCLYVRASRCIFKVYRHISCSREAFLNILFLLSFQNDRESIGPFTERLVVPEGVVEEDTFVARLLARRNEEIVADSRTTRETDLDFLQMYLESRNLSVHQFPWPYVAKQVAERIRRLVGAENVRSEEDLLARIKAGVLEALKQRTTAAARSRQYHHPSANGGSSSPTDGESKEEEEIKMVPTDTKCLMTPPPAQMLNRLLRESIRDYGRDYSSQNQSSPDEIDEALTQIYNRTAECVMPYLVRARVSFIVALLPSPASTERMRRAVAKTVARLIVRSRREKWSLSRLFGAVQALFEGDIKPLTERYLSLMSVRQDALEADLIELQTQSARTGYNITAANWLENMYPLSVIKELWQVLLAVARLQLRIWFLEQSLNAVILETVEFQTTLINIPSLEFDLFRTTLEIDYGSLRSNNSEFAFVNHLGIIDETLRSLDAERWIPNLARMKREMEHDCPFSKMFVPICVDQLDDNKGGGDAPNGDLPLFQLLRDLALRRNGPKTKNIFQLTSFETRRQLALRMLAIVREMMAQNPDYLPICAIEASPDGAVVSFTDGWLLGWLLLIVVIVGSVVNIFVVRVSYLQRFHKNLLFPTQIFSHSSLYTEFLYTYRYSVRIYSK
jgi:hypothetical protein